MNPSPKSFERLVQETRTDLLAYALRRTANAEDAADVVSETYLIAWRKLDRVPSGSHARLWLFGVAGNVLRRGAERDRRHMALRERLADELRDAIPTPQHIDADSGTATGTLRAGLASLSPRDREVLTLTAWEGLTPKQIAAVTGLPANLVRVRLHRARARLAARLRNAGTSDADRDDAPSARYTTKMSRT
jgi:RNA polymerase sigma-70 factor (ECF subfamily)